MTTNSKDIDNGSQATDLAACTITPGSSIQISQIQHRIDLLATWFGSFENAKAQMAGKTVVEIGCGQGDMTAALAYMVSSDERSINTSGRVAAVDPAPLDYGAPYTLGQAQQALSRSKLGKHINWVQADPIEYLAGQGTHRIDFVVFAHSLFYLPSIDYFSNLLRSCRHATSPQTKLLLAEWSMQHSVPEAEAHVLAVKAQMAFPTLDANIRTVLEPTSIKSTAQQTGWRLDGEGQIIAPALQDGSWEVDNARKRVVGDSVDDQALECLNQMESAVQQSKGLTKCMDVWTSVWIH